ncbi:alpha/beta fold hydrolase [Bosea caraganae]|uniref:Alpha/beta fold hydrolase n=1 Tax=Bosea caraganae TaxID=2763117 RepID=A0A370L720_9HYPH|nr:alpha/beta fold hydrolase [Bosea caraganae]
MVDEELRRDLDRLSRHDLVVTGTPHRAGHPELNRGVRRAGLVDFELLSAGGRPRVLVLHGLQSFNADSVFLGALAERGLAFAAPALPGFGGTPRPEQFDGVEDLVMSCLDLIDDLGPEPIALVGLSFGGWIAAEIAVRCPHRLERLVLVDALGIRVNSRETPDILHLFNEPAPVVAHATWAAPAHAPDFAAMPDEAVVTYARNREALCRYGWRPYMHNPRLKRWLHRISVPTLVLWGDQDGIVSPDYGRAYADAIPGARFELVGNAGHHPEIEQPQLLAAAIAAFLTQAQRREVA